MFRRIISLVDIERISIYPFFRWSLIKPIFDICWNLMFIKILTIIITNSMISTLDVFPYPESSLIVKNLKWVFFGNLSHLFPSLGPTLWVYLLFYLWYIHNLIFLSLQASWEWSFSYPEKVTLVPLQGRARNFLVLIFFIWPIMLYILFCV